MTLRFELLTDSEATRRDFTQFVRIGGPTPQVIDTWSYDRLFSAGAVGEDEEGFHGQEVVVGEEMKVRCALTEDAYSLALHLAS
jgi:hypothetical protein